MLSLNLFSQFQLADLLNISQRAYSKIENDETDISISRLQQIANVLDTKMESILDFNSTQVFNQYYNKLANGIVQNQQVVNDDSLKSCFQELKNEISELKKEMINNWPSL